MVEGLQSTGAKVAVRTPMAHKELFPGDRAVTIHNDCIFDGGPQGSDGGTFPGDDRQAWVDYTREVSRGNTYGGEPCSQAGGSSYDWSDFEHVCGPDGLKAYIEYFGISYLNVGRLSPCFLVRYCVDVVLTLACAFSLGTRQSSSSSSMIRRIPTVSRRFRPPC